MLISLDESKSEKILFPEGREVAVPQLGVRPQYKVSDFTRSSFSQSEYVVYNEGQVRMRYVLLIKR